MEKVQVLLSIYSPNIEYLRKQLKSINTQDYEEIELLVFDDNVDNRTDKSVFYEEITRFPIRFLPYEDKNLGYAKAFEKLVAASDAEYIAFCDQDDIWRDDKIRISVNTLKKDNSLIVVSDRTIIDENDDITIPSVKSASNKNYDVWETGDDIVKYNIFVTFAVGMSMVLDGRFARKSIPFCDYTGHDKWLLCCAGIEGKISYVNDQLVKYRRHGKNVSGVLNGICSKKDYYIKRPINQHKIIVDVLNKYPNYKDKDEVVAFSLARINRNIKELKKYSYLAPDVAKFEIVIAFVPEFLFKFMIYIARKISNK